MFGKSDYDLVLMREINSTCEELYRYWTEPELLKQWFCPLPWRVSYAQLDAVSGGANIVVIEGPNGEVIRNCGVYLQVIPNRLLVMTDAYTSAWVPAQKPYVTSIITFENLGSNIVKYTAIARHWSAEDRKNHEDMGFFEEWGAATDQLAKLVADL